MYCPGGADLSGKDIARFEIRFHPSIGPDPRCYRIATNVPATKSIVSLHRSIHRGACQPYRQRGVLAPATLIRSIDMVLASFSQHASTIRLNTICAYSSFS